MIARGLFFLGLIALACNSAKGDSTSLPKFAISESGIFGISDSILFEEDGILTPHQILAWPERIHSEQKLLADTNPSKVDHRMWKSDLSSPEVQDMVAAKIREWASSRDKSDKLAAIIFPNDGLNYPQALQDKSSNAFIEIASKQNPTEVSSARARSARYTLGYLKAYASIAMQLSDIENLSVVGGFYHYYNMLPSHNYDITCNLPRNFVPMVAYYNLFDRYEEIDLNKGGGTSVLELENFGVALNDFYACANQPVWVLEYYWKLNWLGAVWPEYSASFNNAQVYKKSQAVSAVISQDPITFASLSEMLNHYAPMYALSTDGSFGQMLQQFCEGAAISLDVETQWCLGIFSDIVAKTSDLRHINGRKRRRLADLRPLGGVARNYCSDRYGLPERAVELCDQLDYTVALADIHDIDNPERCRDLKSLVTDLGDNGQFGSYEIHENIFPAYFRDVASRAGCPDL